MRRITDRRLGPIIADRILARATLTHSIGQGEACLAGSSVDTLFVELEAPPKVLNLSRCCPPTPCFTRPVRCGSIDLRQLTVLGFVVTRITTALALMCLAAGIAASSGAQAQNAVQGRRDFARIHALNAASQSSLRNRAQEAARDARSVVDGSRIACDVTHARLIGYTRQDKMLLEVACRKSAGFIVDTSTMSPRAFDCRVLAAGAAEARAAGRDVPKNAVCTLPDNVRR